MPPWLMTPRRSGQGSSQARRSRRGVAGIEFALAAPVLVTVALAIYDLAAGIMAWWHLNQAAQVIAQIATTSAAQATQTNTLSDTDARAASTAIYPLLPQLLTPGTSATDYGVVLTGVVFTSNGSVANVAWSVNLQGSMATRACGVLTMAADSASPSSGTLPRSAFSTAPLLVVDVIYWFRPVLASVIQAPIRMMRTTYMPARTGSSNDSQKIGPPSTAMQCP